MLFIVICSSTLFDRKHTQIAFCIQIEYFIIGIKITSVVNNDLQVQNIVVDKERQCLLKISFITWIDTVEQGNNKEMLEIRLKNVSFFEHKYQITTIFSFNGNNDDDDADDDDGGNKSNINNSTWH